MFRPERLRRWGCSASDMGTSGDNLRYARSGTENDHRKRRGVAQHQEIHLRIRNTRAPIWFFGAYPALCITALLVLLAWGFSGGASRSPGRGLGQSWTVFMFFMTLPGYCVAVAVLARPLKRLAPAWLAAAAVLATIATPILAVASWRLAGKLSLSNPALSNWLFGTAPWLAGILAVPGCYLLVASVEYGSRRVRPKERRGRQAS
ncbi:MAG: hypothetical protein ABI035_12860 [Gemmatimonadaceae bacterium]